MSHFQYNGSRTACHVDRSHRRAFVGQRRTLTFFAREHDYEIWLRLLMTTHGTVTTGYVPHRSDKYEKLSNPANGMPHFIAYGISACIIQFAVHSYLENMHFSSWFWATKFAWKPWCAAMTPLPIWKMVIFLLPNKKPQHMSPCQLWIMLALINRTRHVSERQPSQKKRNIHLHCSHWMQHIFPQNVLN